MIIHKIKPELLKNLLFFIQQHVSYWLKIHASTSCPRSIVISSLISSSSIRELIQSSRMSNTIRQRSDPYASQTKGHKSASLCEFKKGVQSKKKSVYSVFYRNPAPSIEQVRDRLCAIFWQKNCIDLLRQLGRF